MSPIASTATALFSWGTLFLQIFIVAGAIVLVAAIFKHPNERLHRLSRAAGEHAILFGLLVSFACLVSSLFYSNVVGFQACDLCWWQRVFLYPQVILFAIAFYNEKVNKIFDNLVFLYSFVFSLVGGAIALFNYYGQMFNPDALAFCGIQGPACSRIFFVSFGYITIPMMSLTAYLVLILLYFFRAHHIRKKNE